MWQPLSGMTLGDIYQGAARSTVENTNPPQTTGPAGQAAKNTGAPVAGGYFGVQVPVLIALGVLAVVLVRYYD